MYYYHHSFYYLYLVFLYVMSASSGTLIFRVNLVDASMIFRLGFGCFIGIAARHALGVSIMGRQFNSNRK